MYINRHQPKIHNIMPHIHTNPGEHDQTASAFIIRTDTSEPKLLLHIHKKLGVLLQPGGHIELKETPWQAVCHEIIEETGYELSQLKILQPQLRLKNIGTAILHPQPVVSCTTIYGNNDLHKHTDLSYAFTTQETPKGTPGENESINLRWVNLEELKSLESNQIFDNVRKIGEFILTKVLNSWEQVELSEFKL